MHAKSNTVMANVTTNPVLVVAIFEFVSGHFRLPSFDQESAGHSSQVYPVEYFENVPAGHSGQETLLVDSESCPSSSQCEHAVA